jgi:hypothetical protein
MRTASIIRDLKHRSASTWLHGATSQKTLNFILAAVRTWNLTQSYSVWESLKLINYSCLPTWRGHSKIKTKVRLLLPQSLSLLRSLVSSGSIVSDYGLDDRAIGVRSPAGAEDFSSNLCVQTGSGAHPASCPMATRGPFPGGKSAAGAWCWPLTPI